MLKTRGYFGDFVLFGREVFIGGGSAATRKRGIWQGRSRQVVEIVYR